LFVIAVVRVERSRKNVVESKTIICRLR
jgi:hypothetical protein